MDNSTLLKNSSFELAVALIAAALALAFLILYPNFQQALDRGKQKRTMADMRTISNAIEAYHNDYKAYPSGRSTVSTIRKQIQGIYIADLPWKDRWGNHYLYHSDGVSSYTITSFGKERKRDGAILYKGLIAEFSNDMAFSNGVFVSFPYGG